MLVFPALSACGACVRFADWNDVGVFVPSRIIHDTKPEGDENPRTPGKKMMDHFRIHDRPFGSVVATVLARAYRMRR